MAMLQSTIDMAKTHKIMACFQPIAPKPALPRSPMAHPTTPPLPSPLLLLRLCYRHPPSVTCSILLDSWQALGMWGAWQSSSASNKLEKTRSCFSSRSSSYSLAPDLFFSCNS